MSRAPCIFPFAPNLRIYYKCYQDTFAYHEQTFATSRFGAPTNQNKQALTSIVAHILPIMI